MDKITKLEQILGVLDKDTVTQEEFVKSFELLIEAVQKIKQANDEEREVMSENVQTFLDKAIKKLKDFNVEEWKSIKQKIDSIKDGVDGYTPVKGVDYQDGYTPIKGVDYFDGENGKDAEDIDIEELATTTAEYIKTLEGEIPMSAVKDLEDTIATLQNRTQMLLQIASQRTTTSTSTGGGHIIEDEGTPLTQRTNLNFTGAGVSVADTGGKTVVTIAGGSGSGITRTINSVSTATNAGDTASVDYVYLVSGTTTITLPTAVGNTNMYTIKNVGVNTVTVDTTSSETIDGSLTITMPVTNQSLDFISNNSNWNIV
jgi:hypothetical protein